MKDLITFIKKNSIGSYKEDVKLEKNTTYKVGGVASLFVYPKNTDKLIILLDKLNKEASKYDFQVKTAQNGIYMMPVVDGKAIEEEEFDKLSDEIKQQYEAKSVLVQEQIMTAISQIKEIERQSDKKISEWQSNIALLTISAHINFLKSK